MTIEELDEDASNIASNILYGAAYSAGIVDLLTMVCRRILANTGEEDRGTLFKELYDQLQTALWSMELPESLMDMLQLDKHKGE
jgi:hypothetical protein